MAAVGVNNGQSEQSACYDAYPSRAVSLPAFGCQVHRPLITCAPSREAGNFCFPSAGPPCYQSAMRTNTHLLLWTLGCFALVCASGSLAMAATTGIGPSFKGPIGLQLYSLREQFARTCPARSMRSKDGLQLRRGGRHLWPVAGTFKAQLAARGIKPIGAHFPYEDTGIIPKPSRSKPRSSASNTPAAPGFRIRATLTRRPAVRRWRFSTRRAKRSPSTA